MSEQDDHPLVVWLEKAIAFFVNNLKMILGVLAGLTVLFALVYFVEGPYVTVTFLLATAGITYKVWGKENTLSFLRRRWKLVIPVTLLLLVFVKPMVMIYGNWMNTDWERKLNPPTIYYVWNVDETMFTSSKAKIQKLDPSKVENLGIRSNILVAANAANIDADQLEAFDPSVMKNRHDFTVIVFETMQVEMPIPIVEGKKSSAEPVVAPMVTQLMVYFVTPHRPDPKKVADGTEEPGFSMVGVSTPPSFDVNLHFLANGFASATGNKIDLNFLKTFLKKEVEEAVLKGAEKG